MKRSVILGLTLGFMVSCQGNLQQQIVFSPAGMAVTPLATSIWLGTAAADGAGQQDKPRYILMEVVPDLMKFKLDTFTVKVEEKIILELDNLDGMQHNLVIGKRGTLKKIGEAADAMLTDPKASEKNYVPECPEVLFATPLLNPGDIYALEFTAPKEPGLYPFVCTFPGHWRMMNGIMKVEKKGS